VKFPAWLTFLEITLGRWNYTFPKWQYLYLCF
jgi:hypothetical protein